MINAQHWNQLPKLLNQFSANHDLVYIEAFFEEEWFQEILARSRLSERSRAGHPAHESHIVDKSGRADSYSTFR